MSFHELMHPRNPYCKPPDFKQLAEEYAEFSKYVMCQKNGKYRIDFKDPCALRALTKVLLKRDFNLEIEIPEKSIIPTVPQRLNYILWIEDLLTKLPKREQSVTGIDIGTGASCIFPLLGFRKNEWRFIATEIDEQSRKCAERNIKQNKLENYITIKSTSKGAILKEVLKDCNEILDFCLCNPPFFEDYDDQRKQKLPHCPKLPEIIVDGGEVSFVKKMIDDSSYFKEKIRIYSSMLGKKKSVKAIINILKNVEGITWTMTNFCQGNTMRWGIAWTYLQIQDFKIETPKKKKKKEKHLPSFRIPSENLSVNDLVLKIKSILNEFQIIHQDICITDMKADFKIKSNKDTWTGQRRKRRELKRKMEDVSHLKLENEEFQSGEGKIKICAQEASGSESRKRKADEVLHKRIKKHCMSDNPTLNDSSLSTPQNFNANKDEKPILNCHIHLTKIENYFVFQLASDSLSNLEIMHQVFYLFHNRLIPQTGSNDVSKKKKSLETKFV